MYDGRTYDCSREMMEKAVEGSVFTTYRILDNTARHKNQQTDVDLTLAEYQELYPVYLDTHRKELTESGKEAEYDVDAEDYAVSYYDATWALALALNASLDQISLVNYKHSQPHVTDVIRQHLRQLAFQGLMGRIAFRCTTHDSSAPLNIHQYIGGTDVLFGGYNGTDLEIYDAAKFVSETLLRRVIGVHTAASYNHSHNLCRDSDTSDFLSTHCVCLLPESQVDQGSKLHHVSLHVLWQLPHLTKGGSSAFKRLANRERD